MATKAQRFAQTVPAPIRFEGQLGCPRCRGRLFFDGDELVCVACGYEYDPGSAAAMTRQLGRG